MPGHLARNRRRTGPAGYEHVLLPSVLALVIVVVWEAYGRWGFIDPLFFSYPSQIVRALVTLARGPLLADLRVSGIEFAVGLGLASVGVPAGILIGSMDRLRLTLDPFVNGLYATPVLALTPLFVLWFGIGMASKIAIVALMAFFPLIINSIEGVATVDHRLVRAARSFGARRRHLYADVVLPSVVPFVVSGLRLAIGRAIMGVVIGEFIAAVGGVGYRIQQAAGVFDTSRYLAGVAVLIVAAIALNLVLRAGEHRLVRWRPRPAT